MSAIYCPSCDREISSEFGDWLWKVKNCPFCRAPLSPVEGEPDLDEPKFYFTTEGEWK